MITISLFYYCKKVSLKDSLKHHYLKEEGFYSQLEMKDITDAITRTQKQFVKLEITKLGQHHDLYPQSDTLLSAGVFENFRNIYLKIYKPDPAKFLSVSGLASQAALKKTKVKLDLLTNIDV